MLNSDFLEYFANVNAAANSSIETLLGEWFPDGKIEGIEYKIGSVSGEKGRSLSICIRGEKIGTWKDFSSDDGGKDIVSLFALANGMTQGKACAAIGKRLGVESVGKHKSVGPPASRPARPSAARAQAGKGVQENSASTEPAWVPVVPVPQRAEKDMPKAHIKRGAPEPGNIWVYRNYQVQGAPMVGAVFRFTTSEGGKDVLPVVYARNRNTGAHEWRWLSFPLPRALYTRRPFRPNFPVLVVEGEKCVDAADELLHAKYDVVSWPGGGMAVEKADWSQLAGRNVILWPDCDALTYKATHAKAGQIVPAKEQPGVMAMDKLQKILLAMGCKVRYVDLPQPGEVPSGWDVADMIENGADAVSLHVYLKEMALLVPLADTDARKLARENVLAFLDDYKPQRPASAIEATDSKEMVFLCLSTTDKGAVIACRENVFQIMQRDKTLACLVGLDTFSHTLQKRRLAPWGGELGEWSAEDDFELGMYLLGRYSVRFPDLSQLALGVAHAATYNRFNPVQEYMLECAKNWDGVSRVAGAFSRYWGAEDSEYTRLVAKMFFVGMVMRAFCPGSKHDCAPVFEGGQGAGKSTALGILGGKWFSDTAIEFGNKDAFLAMQGVLLYEIAELQGFNRTEINVIKGFMSSRKDDFRAPYDKRMKSVLRTTVFAGTTNENTYLKDPTGDRRWWPILVGKVIDLLALAADRDNLFGEAIHLWQQGVKWYPTAQQSAELIKPVQDDRYATDEWETAIYRYLEGVNGLGEKIAGVPKTKVTTYEILTDCIKMEVGKLSAAKFETMRVSQIMSRLGWKKRRQTSGGRHPEYVR